MRLGKIQKLIVKNLYEVGDRGMYFGSTTRCKDLYGLDLEQVERSLEGLRRQRIVYREGSLPITKLSLWVYTKYSAEEIGRMTK